MEIVSTAYGWEFLLRFVHYLAGIAWIGMLFYLNFIQAPFLASELGGQVRSAVILGLLPKTLGWLSWAAMLTFVSGWLLIGMYLGHGGMSLGDGFITRILTGAVLGSVMWFNVWFVVRPAQKLEIQSELQVAGGGEPIGETPARVARAVLASRGNALFAIPLLFFMGSARHLQTFNGGGNDVIYWVLVLVVILLLEVACLIGVATRLQRLLASAVGTVHLGLVLTMVLYLIGVIVNSNP